MAAVRRLVLQLSSTPGFGALQSKASALAFFDQQSLSRARGFSKSVKSNDEKLFLIDDLSLVRRLERQGLTSKQAEAIMAATYVPLNARVEAVSQLMVSKNEMDEIHRIRESIMDSFKVEVNNSQGHRFYQVQTETDKLKNEIEKMRNEWRHGTDKVAAENRADLRIEVVKIHELVSAVKDAIHRNMSKNERDISTLRGELRALKSDLMKYFMGLTVSIFGVAAFCIMFFP